MRLSSAGHPIRRPLLILATLVVWTQSGVVSTFVAAKTPRLVTGYLSKPTDQLGVPGMLPGAEVTPEGDLYTGWAEYELRYGRHLAPWDQPTRTLPDPGLPLLSSTLIEGDIRYTQTLFAVALAGEPVVYETVRATNYSARRKVAQVQMGIAYTRGSPIIGPHGLPTTDYRYERPVTGQPDGYYDQPGQPFSPGFLYSFAGRDLDRSGLLLARGPASGGRQLSTQRTSTPTALHDVKLFKAKLDAHGHLDLTWQIPLDPPRRSFLVDANLDRLSLNGAQAALRHVWHAEEEGLMRIDVPEHKVTAAYEAAIAEILSSRYRSPKGWVQGSNKLQYQAFWIRDAAVETQALDLAGLHTQAAENLSFLDGFQEPGGLFISRLQQYDGLGQALWAIDQHAQLTQDSHYASAQLGRVEEAVEWLSAATGSDPLGLLPAGNPGDDELAYGHITGDNLWAVAGLRSAVAIATLAGRGDLAAVWQTVDDRYEASLDLAIAGAVARVGHIPPVLDSTSGRDWGNYYVAYPVQVLGASSQAVKATVAWARSHMAEGLPTYDEGRSLHDYLGFPIFQTELASGDAKDAIAGLYAELAHTTSTDGGWEWDVPPYGSRASLVDLAPHGTFAGDYVALLRNMLVREVDGRIDLLGGASPAWLAPGDHITVRGAPTGSGTISFTERSTANGEALHWTSSLAPSTRLTWTLPSWARRVRIAGRRVIGSTVMLPAHSGSLEVAFGGRRPAQSYALAVAALDAAYRAHGRPAPLLRANG